MSLFVKICGITDIEAGMAAAEAGVDAVGFVFARSVRQINPDEASDIASRLPESIARVAVFRRPTQREVDHVLARFAADLVQADIELRPALPHSVGYLPVFRVNGETDRMESYRAETPEPMMVFEGVESGVGQAIDWDLAAGVARLGRIILAGGLDPGNVGGAVRRVRPFGVDVSSGVESTPGVKDPNKVKAFVRAARLAGERRRST